MKVGCARTNHLVYRLLVPKHVAQVYAIYEDCGLELCNLACFPGTLAGIHTDYGHGFRNTTSCTTIIANLLPVIIVPIQIYSSYHMEVSVFHKYISGLHI